MTGDGFGDERDYDQGDCYDPARDCPRCCGTGKIPTADHESYLGAMYKPCPECGGDPCIGEPRLT
jgi:hypothetical protein